LPNVTACANTCPNLEEDTWLVYATITQPNIITYLHPNHSINPRHARMCDGAKYNTIWVILVNKITETPTSMYWIASRHVYNCSICNVFTSRMISRYWTALAYKTKCYNETLSHFPCKTCSQYILQYAIQIYTKQEPSQLIM